jgi:hypothetical protein
LDVSVYVDGFNLYYAIRHRGFKWLDLRALAAAALPPGLNITAIKYYTARVSGAVDPGAPGRQQTYLNALTSIPEVTVYFGNFLAKAQWRPILNFPVADRDITHGPNIARFPQCPATVGLDANNPQSRMESAAIGRYGTTRIGRPRPAVDAIKAEVFALEEKGSDVNLAVHLVHDAWSNLFDAAAVITNDTDLVEPIRIVVQDLGKPVYLLPAQQKTPSTPLVTVASSVRHIRDAHLRASLFPDPVQTPSGREIYKPPSW